MPLRPQHRELLRRVALLVLSPLLMLAAVEYVLWAFDIEPPGAEAGAPAVGEPFDSAGLRASLDRGAAQRFICLGESSVAGTPFEGRSGGPPITPTGAGALATPGRSLNMCTLMRSALAQAGRPLELVNLAAPAQDSNDILARGKVACAVPGAFVYAYFGHNEFLHLERWPYFRPPESVQAAGHFFARFRFFRLLRRWLAPADPRGTDFDVAALTDAQVYARFEENTRALLEACRGARLVLSTVVANPDMGFPASGMSLRETWRRFGGFDKVPTTKTCRSCFRAGPEVNRTLRRLAGEYASDNLLFVDVEDLAASGRGAEQFWDHCHPRPALHEAIAARTLDAMAARGWVPKAGRPASDLSAGELWHGRFDRALFLLQFDPVACLRELDAMAPELEGQGGPELLARAIAAFVTDDSASCDRALAALAQSLEVPQRRADVEATLASDAKHSFWRRWRGGVVVTASERAELAERARRTGSELLVRLIEDL